MRIDWSVRIAGLSLALVLAGCADNLDRRDTISPSAGNAKAANVAIQTISPWPRAAFTTTERLDGARSQQIMERYRANEKIAPAQTATQ